MKIAITGGTGFVGRHLAQELLTQGHEVVIIARGRDQRDLQILTRPKVTFAKISTESAEQLSAAFKYCDAIAHCAGINREIGKQTYQQVHVDGTRNVVTAAQQAGVKKIVLLSFLRARPNCGSGYHESKWAAEEIVRASGLDYTVFKAGVIYGKGDHMLDHLSHAFHTFPIFALVGFKDQPIRPTAVEDVVRIMFASLIKDALRRKTVAVVGSEEMTLREAVERVAQVVRKKPVIFKAPLLFHYALAWFAEKIMAIPLISIAQTRILSEGVTEALPQAEPLPAELQPRIPFSAEQIQKGLPERVAFNLNDLRCCNRKGGNHHE